MVSAGYGSWRATAAAALSAAGMCAGLVSTVSSRQCKQLQGCFFFVVKDEAYIAVSQQVRMIKPKLTVAADYEFETEQAVIL